MANKTPDYVKSLKAKSADELKTELVALRKEQFNLRMQAAVGQMNKGHLVRDARKKIARVKTFMQQQTKQAQNQAKAS